MMSPHVRCAGKRPRPYVLMTFMASVTSTPRRVCRSTMLTGWRTPWTPSTTFSLRWRRRRGAGDHVRVHLSVVRGDPAPAADVRPPDAGVLRVRRAALAPQPRVVPLHPEGGCLPRWGCGGRAAGAHPHGDVPGRARSPR